MLHHELGDVHSHSRRGHSSNNPSAHGDNPNPNPVPRATRARDQVQHFHHHHQNQNHHHGGDRKMAFGQLRQAVSTQLCDLLDDAGLHATRVVSGRRFVRWDTVPKLLAQQNQFISGLPYDFFFSKSIAPIMTGNAHTKASPPIPSATTAGNSNSNSNTPTPSRKRHSYHNSDSDTYSNELGPPPPHPNPNPNPRHPAGPSSSSETDAASYGTNPDNTNDRGNHGGGRGATDLVDTEMELLETPLNQLEVASPSEENKESINLPPPSNENGIAIEEAVHTPTSTAQTIVGQLHAQPLNINILSWKKSTIEDILAGLRSGRIRVGSRPQGRDVVFELMTPDNEPIDIPKWPELHIPNVMHPSSNTNEPFSPTTTTANTNNAGGGSGGGTSQGAPFSTPASASWNQNPGSNSNPNTASQYQAEVGAIRNTRSDRERRRRLSIGGGINSNSGVGAGTGSGPASSAAAAANRASRIRAISGSTGGTRTSGPGTAPATPITSSFPPTAPGVGGLNEDAKTPNHMGDSQRDSGEEDLVSHHGYGRPSPSIAGGEGSPSANRAADYGNGRWLMEEQDEDQENDDNAEEVRGRRMNTDSPLATSSGHRHASAATIAPPSTGAIAGGLSAPRTTFLTTPTPTKKWTRRSSPDRIFMNVTLNGLLRTSGMPIPRQKDDASRLPWSSIPQFLAERGLYVTGWPEANLPWLYSGDDNGGPGSTNNGGNKGPAASGEWKDRIDWKSSPSQRSYKPLAQALRNGDIRILKRPQGREVLFEVRDAQGRCYDSTLGLSEEWKRRWMYGGGNSNDATAPTHTNPTTNGSVTRKKRGGPSQHEEPPYPTAVARHAEMDVDMDDHHQHQGRARRPSHHSRSYSNPVVVDRHDTAPYHHVPPPPHHAHAPTDSDSPVSHHHHYLDRRVHYDARSGYATTGSSTPLGHQAPYHAYDHHHQQAQSYHRPGPQISYHMRQESAYRQDPRQYNESDARFQRTPQSLNATPTPTPHYHASPAHSAHSHSHAPYAPSSPPVPIPGSSVKRERETPSPDSSSQRQRTVSLGTSGSASTGTGLSVLSSSSASASNNNKWRYDLPPIRGSGYGSTAAAGVDRYDVVALEDGPMEDDMRRMNRLPPIQLQFDDTDDEKNGGQNVLLPPVNTLGSMTVPFPGPGTPTKPSIRSPLDSGRWYHTPTNASNTPRTSPSIITKSSPPDIRPRPIPRLPERPSPPSSSSNNTSNTSGSNTLSSIPKHVPVPQNAFSPPFWDATQRTWRLSILDMSRACLPPVGDQIEWDGKWVLNSGSDNTGSGGEDGGAPYAFWSVDQQAWVLVS